MKTEGQSSFVLVVHATAVDSHVAPLLGMTVCCLSLRLSSSFHTLVIARRACPTWQSSFVLVVHATAVDSHVASLLGMTEKVKTEK